MSMKSTVLQRLRAIVCIVLVAIMCLAFAPVPPPTEYVTLGGFPIGISLDVGGLIVDGVTGVETNYGTAYINELRVGDVIRNINGHPVTEIGDITDCLQRDEKAELIIERGGNRHNVTVMPITEVYSNKPRLGIKVKDKIHGIGTVTYVAGDGRFSALGHEIYDVETHTHLGAYGGSVYECKILGIKTGTKNEAGAILASLLQDKKWGSIECNDNFGICGVMQKQFDGEKIAIATRDKVSPGAAQIRTTVGFKPEYYDIEIIKATKQSSRKEKGLVFKVTDKKLLKQTGGIIRGMSGSPIIQNGKLVGAVTHVFLNDMAKGYGVYAEFLNG